MALVTNAAMDWSVQQLRVSVLRESPHSEAVMASGTNAAMDWFALQHRVSVLRELWVVVVAMVLATDVIEERYINWQIDYFFEMN